jgi:hypothetical protein
VGWRRSLSCGPEVAGTRIPGTPREPAAVRRCASLNLRQVWLPVALVIFGACVLVGGRAPAATAAAPRLSWSYPSAGGAGHSLSCPSASLCVSAVDNAVCCGINGQLIPEADLLASTDPTDPSPVWTVTARDVEDEYYPYVTGISCPSVSLCAASQFQGGLAFASTDPAGGWGQVRAGDLGISVGYEGVACAASGLCILYTPTYTPDDGNIAVSADATTGFGNPQTIDGDSGLTGGRCVSTPTSLCVLTDASGNVVVSTNPADPSPTWTVTNIDGGPLSGVSCASSSFCVAFDGNGNGFVSADPSAASPIWTPTRIAASLTALSCLSRSWCVAVDAKGNSYASADPADPSPTWTTVVVDHGYALNAVTCFSTKLCIAGDRGGQLFVGTPPLSATAPPAITGAAVDGHILTAQPGSWSDTAGPVSPVFTYQWQLCTDASGDGCTNIQTATSRFYKLTSATVGKYVTVIVTATDQRGFSGHATATPAGPVAKPPPPTKTKAPVISGTLADGQTLRTSTGSWTSPDKLTYHYQWRLCPGASSSACTNIQSATNSFYKLTSATVGKYVTVTVTATDQEGQTGHATATPAGPVAKPPPPTKTKAPVISGTPADGQTLRTSTGSWTSPDKLTYHYQWRLCPDASGNGCTNIQSANATNSFYTLTSTAVGKYITVIVAATDQEGQAGHATATPVGPVTS